MADTIALRPPGPAPHRTLQVVGAPALHDDNRLFGPQAYTGTGPLPPDDDLLMPAGWWIVPFALLGAGFWALVAAALF